VKSSYAKKRLNAAKQEFDEQRMQMLETLEDRAVQLRHLEQQFAARQEAREKELQAWQDRLLVEHQGLRAEEERLRAERALLGSGIVEAPAPEPEPIEVPLPASEVTIVVPPAGSERSFDTQSPTEIEFSRRIAALMQSMQELSAMGEAH